MTVKDLYKFSTNRCLLFSTFLTFGVVKNGALIRCVAVCQNESGNGILDDLYIEKLKHLLTRNLVCIYQLILCYAGLIERIEKVFLSSGSAADDNPEDDTNKEKTRKIN